MTPAYPYTHRIAGVAAPKLGRTSFGATDLVQKTSVDLPIDWRFMAGAAAGSAVVGMGIGYTVQRNRKAAVTGMLASLGLWAGADAIREMWSGHKLFGAAMGAAGVGMLTYAWMRKN